MAPTPFGGAGIYGGGERYPLELGRALAAHTECELVTFGSRAATWREPGGLVVRQLRATRRLRGHPAHPLAPRMLVEPYLGDVVHVHHVHALPSQLAALAAHWRGGRVVVTDHGLEGGWPLAAARLYHGHLAVSAYSARRVRLPPERSPVIYGGAVESMFTTGRSTRREGLVFVGRLTPHKGVDRLLRALPSGLRLTVVGTGGHDQAMPERTYPDLLRRLSVGKDVRFAGALDTTAMAELVARSEALVLPSVLRTCFGKSVNVPELLGLVVLEAMAAGTPVIASDLGGLPEVVRHGETGFLVPPHGVAELRDRISEIHGDRRLARQLGEAGRDWAVSRFTWGHCALRCLSAYEQLPYTPSGRAATSITGEPAPNSAPS